MDWNPVIPLCQESLPAVFDDSLSYYEAVCKVAGSFNKLVEYVNTSLEGFVDSSREYTDEAIANARVEFDQKAEELQNDYNAFVNLVDNNIQALQLDINKIDNKVTTGIAGANAYTDAKIEQNNDFIFDQISSQLVDIKVINFFTGEKVTVQEMFDYLCSLHLQNAINYKELIRRNNNYTQLAGLNMSYTNLVKFGSTLIPDLA